MAVKQKGLTNEEYLRDARGKGRSMAYRYKILVALTEHFVGISIL